MGLTMPAVVLDDPPALRLVERPLPAARDHHDVLVRIVATGICGTDRGIALGLFPGVPGVILGHEAIGVVAETGNAVTRVKVGDRVVLNPTFSCGRCGPCKRGLAANCASKAGRELGVDCDGTMTHLAVVAERFVHRIPAHVPDRRAVLIEPLACVLNNVAAAAPRPDDDVLIAGAGPIGTMCALVLAAGGARPRLFDRDPVRVAHARAALGPAARVVLKEDGHLGGAGDRPPDVVIDTVGSLMEQALEVVADAGRVVVMGEHERARALVAPRSIVVRGISIVGAGPYAPDHFEQAIKLACHLPLESVVSHALPLDRYEDAFALLGVGRGDGVRAAGYAAMKVLLTCADDSLEA